MTVGATPSGCPNQFCLEREGSSDGANYQSRVVTIIVWRGYQNYPRSDFNIVSNR